MFPSPFRASVVLPILGALAAPLSVAAQVEFLSLGDSTDDDGPITAVFGSQDRYLFTGHLYSGTITRLDLSTGLIDRSVDIGSSANVLTLAPGGQQLLALDGETGVVSVLDLPGLGLNASIPTGLASAGGFGGATELLVTANGASAIVASATEVAVLDLAAGGVARQWSVPGFSSFAQLDRFHLADDDLTLSVLVQNGSSAALEAYDISTGLLRNTVSVGGLQVNAVSRILQSGDRSALAVMSHRSAPAQIEARSFDSATLLQGGTTAYRGSTRVGFAQLDRTGSRIFQLFGPSWNSFPLTGGTVNAGDPGVTQISVPGPYGGLGSFEFALSSDETRLLISRPSGGYLAADTSTGIFSVLSSGTYGGRPRARTQSGASFAILEDQLDRISIVDASGPGAPTVLVDVNSGFGDEADGPFEVLALEPGSLAQPTLLAAGRGSDHLVQVDPDTGSMTGRVRVARGPIVMREVPGGLVLVGHEDGTVLLLDPASLIELDRLSYGGPVTEIEVEPNAGPVGSVQVWIRTEEGGPSGLHRFDVSAGGQLTPVTGGQFTVSEGNRRSRVAPHVSGSLAIDWVNQWAYLMDASTFAFEVVDIGPSIPVSAYSPGLSSSADVAFIGQVELTEDGRSLVGFLRGPFFRGPVVLDSALLTGGAVTPRWSHAVQGTHFTFARTSNLHLTSGDTEVIVDASGGTDVGSIYAPGVVALRVADGSEVAALGLSNSTGFDVRSGRVVLTVFGDLVLARYDGQTFSDLERIPNVRPTIGSPALVPSSSYAYVQVERLPLAQEPEGLILVDLADGRTQTACGGGVPNATGVQSSMDRSGSVFAGERLDLTVRGLQPGGMFGMLVVGSQLVPPSPAGTGVGQLCVGGSVGLLTSQVQVANAAGHHVFALDTSSVGTSIGSLTFQPGETWTFQGWHRDQLPSGAATSNASTALAITFR